MENYDGKMRLAGKITLKNYFQDISGAAVLMVDGTIFPNFPPPTVLQGGAPPVIN
jgi:hypothetical protein